MEIETSFSENNTVYTIYIKGDFDFSSLQKYRDS